MVAPHSSFLVFEELKVNSMVRPPARGRKRPISDNEDSLEERLAKVAKKNNGQNELSLSHGTTEHAAAVDANLENKTAAAVSGTDDVMTPAPKKLSVALPEAPLLGNVLAVVSPETIALPPVMVNSVKKRQAVVGAEKRKVSSPLVEKVPPSSQVLPDKQHEDDTAGTETHSDSLLAALFTKMLALLTLLWTGIASSTLIKVVKERTVTAWARIKTFAAHYREEEMSLMHEFKIHLANMAGTLKDIYIITKKEIRDRSLLLWTAVKKIRLDHGSIVVDRMRQICSKLGTKLAAVANVYWKAEYCLLEEIKVKLASIFPKVQKCMIVTWSYGKTRSGELKLRTVLLWTALLAYLPTLEGTTTAKAKSEYRVARQEPHRKVKATICAVVVPSLVVMIILHQWWSPPVNNRCFEGTATCSSTTNKTLTRPRVRSSSVPSTSPAVVDLNRYHSSPIGLTFVTQQLMNEEDRIVRKKASTSHHVASQPDVANLPPSTSPVLLDFHSSPIGFAYVAQKLTEGDQREERSKMMAKQMAMKKTNGNRRHASLSIFPIVLR